MDELTMKGCKEVILLTLQIKKMKLKDFYKNVIDVKIDGKYFATSEKTVQRYFNNKPEAGKRYELFLEYSAEVLGISKDLIISVGKFIKDQKVSDLKKIELEKIEYVINRQLSMIKVERFSDELTYMVAYMEFLKRCDKDVFLKFSGLHIKCLKLSPKLRDFIFSLSSDDEKDIQVKSKFIEKLEKRISVRKLDFNKKDFRILMEIKLGYINYGGKLTGDDLWTWRFYSILEENKENLDIALKYALLN